jgi:rhodanese-related sulfurtransferase
MREILMLLLLVSFSTHLMAGKPLTENAKNLMEEAKKEVKPLTPKEFKKWMDDDVEFIQLDVREDDQYGHGEIWTEEMVRLTRGYIEYKVEHKIKDKKAKIVVVCCSGKRSLLAAQTLKKLGYKSVYYLEGGVYRWINDGYPLDTVFGELYLKNPLPAK